MDPSQIRNFCIIAHIDHGKSTLADRFLEITGTVRPQDMKAQFMDQMELERERGITIKGKAVTMSHRAPDGQTYQLNLIDTPGHVDFSYEVSRALAACEGALLVVDASQGIEAQTIANTLLAMEYDLDLVPVINKVDLPQAEPQRVAAELRQVFGFKEDEVLFVSAKKGTGARDILDAVVDRIPPPQGETDQPLRALVFDSVYNPYKGIIAHIRVTDGSVSKNERIQVMSSGNVTEVVETGVFAPFPSPVDTLYTGQVGYIATGFKDVRECSVGDTLTGVRRPASESLPGYVQLKSMVFAGLYPSDGEDYGHLRSALEKLQLNDASLTMEPESSVALGFGFRCGFLGLMHLEIVQERLEREYDLDLVLTAPGVAYQVVLTNGETILVDSPAKLPPPTEVQEIREPILNLTIVAPNRHVGVIMELMHSRRSEYQRMEYIQGQQGPGEGEITGPDQGRVVMEYTMPLVELLADFYNQLKSRTQGYASLDYTLKGYQAAPLVKMDILINQVPVEALSMILHRGQAARQGRAAVEKLRSAIPRQLFEVPIQAAIGGRIIARETVRAMRKDVLAKCYGGDITRKRKLLEKQKEGKKRLKMVGRVEIPQEAFLSLLKLNAED
ncbi:MAG: translation elongation factor 4 [Dehalococcoidia bacterium]|jgi:GTP-binding protein LepA|nr:translation elongation factor 4 [Dehalococcoidia bacterium]MDP6228385.1 translation elongation factor 4 [Dehalococcoidia bacterium]MDP7085099.1 translation elongation factor 4 [Dehalococcoidia bacterium]MDP7199986.1 translation elongation factor 4 [Dehalococcoidia bacterium]MDP7509959.1 translation elongation factor 4 [Dehalococcoidia bacterium]